MLRRRMLLDQKPKGALYWYGDECTDVTGGWVVIPNFSTGIITKASDHIELYYNYGRNSQVGIKLNNNINITEYTTAYIECYTPQAKPNNFSISIRDTNDLNRKSIEIPNDLNDYVISSLDITNIGAWHGLANIWIYGQYYNQSSGTAFIKRIWLE